MEAADTTRRNERIVVMLLCLVGAAHVFVFSAIFPFFSVPDEQVHFDLVVRYSHGDIPRSLTPPDAEALPFMTTYGTPEYLSAPGSLPGGRVPPPPWKQRAITVRDKLAATEATYQAEFKNHEAASPPLYYGLAGAWWRLGKALKLNGAELLYWLRFLNVPLVVVLIWVAWLAARQVFPEDIFVHLAVPMLIVVLPQTAFYAIGDDVLTPVTFGVAFVLLLKFFDADQLSPLLAVATGLALAAAFLTKLSNLPLLAAAGLSLGLKVVGLMRRGKLRASLVPLLILLVTAALPMVAWMAWCRANFGDWTGASLKSQFLGWTVKPAHEWLSHPIYSGAGFWYFLKRNLATFWQGEMMWHRQPLMNADVNSAYVVLTLGALAFTFAGLLLRPPPFTTAQRSALWLAFLCFLGSLAFFGLLSVRYDFHGCIYPSREHPFFVSGRLMLGMLVPFLILFACGLDRLLKPFQYSTKFFLLFGMLGFMLASEISIDLPVLFNDYNWFHL